MDSHRIETKPLTDAERAELMAERRALVAEIKRLLKRQRRVTDLDDNGNMGVFHSDFLAGWDGVLLKPPSFS